MENLDRDVDTNSKVMISGPKESAQERADGDFFVGSEERVETESVL